MGTTVALCVVATQLLCQFISFPLFRLAPLNYPLISLWSVNKDKPTQVMQEDKDKLKDNNYILINTCSCLLDQEDGWRWGEGG